MNPTADDIARGIVAAARVTGAEPLDVYEGRFSGIYAGKVGKARGAVCFALAGFWDREMDEWALWFRWAGTEASAYQFMVKHRRNGVPRGAECVIAAEQMGMDGGAPGAHDDSLRQIAASRRKAGKRIEDAQKRCEETAQAARAELAKAEPPAPAPKPARIVGSLSANRTKPEIAAPKPLAPPKSEEEAAARLFASIPDRRSF